MTLAAVFYVDEVPILLSDLLVTDTGDPQPTAKPLPVLETRFIAEAYALAKRDRPGLGLTRKVVLIDSRLLVAFAGDRSQAERVLNHLLKQWPSLNPTRAALTELLSKSNTPGGTLRLVGWLRDESGLSPFYWTSDKPKQLTRKEWSIGSGATLFRKVAPDFLHSPSGSGTPLKTALRKTLDMTSSLLAEDLTKGEPLLNHFGGGYEVHYHDGSCFRRIESITYLFCSTMVDPGIKMLPVRASRLVRYSYQGESLVAQKFERVSHPVNLEHTETHVAPRLLAKRERAVVTDDISSTYYCIVLIGGITKLRNGRPTTGGDKATFHGGAALAAEGMDELLFHQPARQGMPAALGIGPVLRKLLEELAWSASVSTPEIDALVSNPTPEVLAQIRTERPKLYRALAARASSLAEQGAALSDRIKLQAANEMYRVALLLKTDDVSLLQEHQRTQKVLETLITTERHAANQQK